MLVLIVLTGIFFLGYSRYPVWNPEPVPIHDTIVKIDTVHHTIISEYPYYISKTDTIILRDTIPAIVDTALILQKHFAYYTYSRSWNDSLLSVSLTDVITENKVMGSEFSYRILRPQTVINNTDITYNYQKYIYAGLSVSVMNPKYTSINAYGAFSRTLIGIGYVPFANGAQLTAAYRIASFK